MSEPTYQTTAAFHELLALLRDADQQFLSGPRAAIDAITVIEGYRWLTEMLSVALDCYVWADTARPSMVSLVGPTRKFGGDNADAFYYFAPIDPRRTYRLSGQRGDSVYLSLTVYGGPTDGRWSNRIVATLNNRALSIAADGTFEVILSPDEHPGNWLRLDPDAVCVVTRDYLIDPLRGLQASWRIEATDPVAPPRLSDADMAERLRATVNFIRDLMNICPLPFDESTLNEIEEPYPQPQVTYGWAAADASYAMGAFDLEDDQALIIEGTSPPCIFWNMCLWNPFLQTYDYRYERVTINGGQVAYEPDGSWRIVVAAIDPGVSNWVSTAGHRRGRIWFRWFLPEAPATRPRTKVVSLASLRA